VAIKAIIFDCFGVLIMSGGNSLKHDFPNLSQELRDLTLQSDYQYIDRKEYDQKIAEITGIPVSEVESRYWAKNIRYEPVFEWIRSLKDEGIYKIGLLSNIGKEWLDDFLPEAERHDLFDGEILSGVVGIVKPDVRIFEMMAEHLGVETYECVMIDDLLSNTEGAARAGMATVLFGSVQDAKADLQRVIAEHA